MRPSALDGSFIVGESGRVRKGPLSRRAQMTAREGWREERLWAGSLQQNPSMPIRDCSLEARGGVEHSKFLHSKETTFTTQLQGSAGAADGAKKCVCTFLREAKTKTNSSFLWFRFLKKSQSEPGQQTASPLGIRAVELAFMSRMLDLLRLSTES